MSTDDAGNGGAKTFTQAELDAVVRDRLARERTKYADYDELKAKATEADKAKGQLDKMSEQLESLTRENEAAKIEKARRDVADELGLTPKEAKRLHGKTFDELLSDGKDLVDDLGIDVKARKQGKGKSTTDGAGSGDGERESGGDDDNSSGSGSSTEQESETGNGAGQREERRSRPRENLRSGARMSPGGTSDESKDPLALIAGVPRRY